MIIIPNGVTSIEEWTICDCASLHSIEIPKSVISIKEYAIYCCDNLKSIRFHHQEIEKCEIANSVFEGMDFDNCTLYIPSGTQEVYRKHPVFSKFKNISEKP